MTFATQNKLDQHDEYKLEWMNKTKRVSTCYLHSIFIKFGYLRLGWLSVGGLELGLYDGGLP